MKSSWNWKYPYYLSPLCGSNLLTSERAPRRVTIRTEQVKGDQFLLPRDCFKFTVGLGWTTSQEDLDLDASCILLNDKDGDGDLDPVGAVAFFNKEVSGIRSTGDNRSGAGSGDDEQIVVDIDKVAPDISALAFVVTIYTSGRSFKEVLSSYIRLFDPVTQHEFARLTLDGSCKKSGVIFCVISRGATPPDPWSVLSVGEPCEGKTCREVTCGLWDGSLDATSSGGCCSLS